MVRAHRVGICHTYRRHNGTVVHDGSGLVVAGESDGLLADDVGALGAVGVLRRQLIDVATLGGAGCAGRALVLLVGEGEDDVIVFVVDGGQRGSVGVRPASDTPSVAPVVTGLNQVPQPEMLLT